jgi:uncharacterized protein (TIGR02145 family)
MTHFCSGNAPHALCGGDEYNPETEFCSGGTVQGKCGDAAYDPQTQFCRGDAVYARCGGAAYTASQFCQAGTDEVKDLCGGETFTAAQGCCVSSKYTTATQFCQAGSNAVKELCGGAEFTAAQFCSGTSIVGKCGGTVEYAPSTESCCGSNKYTTATQGCCGTATFTQASHFCYASSSKVGSFCGNRKADSDKYDPDKYECRSSTNANGIYLKANISYESKSYKAVLIGTQTWMAENLNYNASGSKCGNGSSLSDTNTSSCDTYGRLYNWATAMANSASSSKNPSEVKGVCPTGWHLPSDAEWTALTDFVGGSAGTKLKSTSGWNSNGNGTDEYGFSALPGGDGSSDGGFSSAGSYGYWWSATENDASDAYGRYMYFNYASVSRSYYYETNLFSVRCVQD